MFGILHRVFKWDPRMANFAINVSNVYHTLYNVTYIGLCKGCVDVDDLSAVVTPRRTVQFFCDGVIRFWIETLERRCRQRINENPLKFQEGGGHWYFKHK